MFPLIHQMAQKGACITHDRKKLIISLSEKVDLKQTSAIEETVHSI